MFVKLWMTSNVLTVNSSQPIAEVEQIMRENRIRRVPVVDDGHLVGIISREDIFRALPSIFDPSISPENLDQAGRIDQLLDVWNVVQRRGGDEIVEAECQQRRALGVCPSEHCNHRRDRARISKLR